MSFFAAWERLCSGLVPKREYLVINRIILSVLKFFCDDTKIIEELFLVHSNNT